MPTRNNDLHVVFGTGPSGVATARALIDAGKTVRVVNRSGSRNDLLPEGADVVAADVTDPASARRAAEGAAVVYSCLNAPYHRWEEMFPPLQNGIVPHIRRASTETYRRMGMSLSIPVARLLNWSAPAWPSSSTSSSCEARSPSSAPFCWSRQRAGSS